MRISDGCVGAEQATSATLHRPKRSTIAARFVRLPDTVLVPRVILCVMRRVRKSRCDADVVVES